MSRLFLIRHANTFDSSADAYWVGAKQDLPLSTSGLAQLPDLYARVSARLHSATPLVVCSPLERARSTADVFRCPIKVDDRLCELDFGPWSGKSDTQICVCDADRVALMRWRTLSIVPTVWGLDESSTTAHLSAFMTECSKRDLTIAVTSNGCLKLVGKLLGGDGEWSVKTANFCELHLHNSQWQKYSWNG